MNPRRRLYRRPSHISIVPLTTPQPHLILNTKVVTKRCQAHSRNAPEHKLQLVASLLLANLTPARSQLKPGPYLYVHLHTPHTEAAAVECRNRTGSVQTLRLPLSVRTMSSADQGRRRQAPSTSPARLPRLVFHARPCPAARGRTQRRTQVAASPTATTREQLPGPQRRAAQAAPPSPPTLLPRVPTLARLRDSAHTHPPSRSAGRRYPPHPRAGRGAAAPYPCVASRIDSRKVRVRSLLAGPDC